MRLGAFGGGFVSETISLHLDSCEFRDDESEKVQREETASENPLSRRMPRSKVTPAADERDTHADKRQR